MTKSDIREVEQWTDACWLNFTTEKNYMQKLLQYSSNFTLVTGKQNGNTISQCCHSGWNFYKMNQSYFRDVSWSYNCLDHGKNKCVLSAYLQDTNVLQFEVKDYILLRYKIGWHFQPKWSSSRSAFSQIWTFYNFSNLLLKASKLHKFKTVKYPNNEKTGLYCSRCK